MSTSQIVIVVRAGEVAEPVGTLELTTAAPPGSPGFRRLAAEEAGRNAVELLARYAKSSAVPQGWPACKDAPPAADVTRSFLRLLAETVVGAPDTDFETQVAVAAARSFGPTVLLGEGWASGVP